MALVLVVGLVLVSTVGRSFVFPEQWTAEFAPYVDELQSEYSIEFADSLEVEELPPAAYGTRVAEVVLGPGWADRLPEWRALGVVGGRVSVAEVEAVVANRYPAHFDPSTRSIVVSDAVDPTDRTVASKLALRVALASEVAADARKVGPLLGLTGLDRLDRLAWWSVDEAIAGPGFEFFDDPSRVPLPVGYVLRAPARIGRISTGGAPVLAPGTPPSRVLLDGLDDDAVATIVPEIVAGDRPLLDPIALGSDDWALVWAGRLDPEPTLLMADALAADSYSVVDRNGSTCVVAVLEATDVAAGDLLAFGLAVWVAGAPPDTAAVARLDETRIRLDACDPGVVALPPPLTAIEVVLGRQLARLPG